MNCHFNNWAFERSPFVNPKMREHTHTESECDPQQVSFIGELVLTDRASNNADTDMNASVVRKSHQAKIVQVTPLPPISGTFKFLFGVICIFPSQFLFAIGLK